MQAPPPPLLPVFRSRVQAELLTQLLLNPNVEVSLTRLADVVDASVSAVSREIDRAEAAGLVRSRRVGNTRLVSADRDSPLFEPLAELLLRAFGPRRIIGEEFGGIDGVEELYLFGSWAARYSGEGGPAPEDIDVLVIGTPDRNELFDAARRSEHRLGRPVQATVRSRDSWDESEESFIRQVRSHPLVVVDTSQ